MAIYGWHNCRNERCSIGSVCMPVLIRNEPRKSSSVTLRVPERFLFWLLATYGVISSNP